MRLKRSIQRYGKTPEPVTPYQKAAQVWDERLGSARVQAHNWRLMAFGSLILSMGLTGGMVWMAGQARVTPYIVEVDKLGEVRAVGSAEASYRPKDAQIAWHLSRFIANVRGLSVDPVLVRRNWLDAYDFATERGARFLSEYARANDPFADIGERSTTVQVTSVVRASPDSFQVKWTEQRFERGSLAETSRWTGILSLQIKPPRTAEALRKNPLGLFVDAIAWSRELEPQEPSPRRTRP